MTEEVTKWDVIWTLFHKLWGHCKESPEYNKGEWKELQARLQDCKIARYARTSRKERCT